MAKRKSVIIIGSGIGGIVTAGSLACKGYDVTIFEKNAFSGGRCGSYLKDEHRFDVGATFLMMPGVYKKAFSSVGKSMTQELNLSRIDPIYRIKFPGEKEILFSSDLVKMQSQFDELEPGSFGRYFKSRKGYLMSERSKKRK